MSLFPEEPRGGRSRSRSRDRRSKDESNPETPSSWADIREPSYVYPEDDFDDRYKRPSDKSHTASGALPYPEEGGIYSMLPGNQSLYSYDSQQPAYRTVSPTQESSYRPSREKADERPPGAFPEDDPREKDTKKDKERDNDSRIRFAEPRDDKYSRKDEEDKLKYLPQKYARKDDTADKKKEDDSKLQSLPQKYIRKYITGDDSSSSDEDDNRRSRKDKDEDDLAYGKPSVPRRPKKDNTDLAYGKGGGAPSASEPSSQREQATYGSYVSGDRWDDKRGSTYGSRNDEYDQRKSGGSSAPEYGQYYGGESSRKDDSDSRRSANPPAPEYGQYHGGEPSRKDEPDPRRGANPPAPEYGQYYGAAPSRKEEPDQRKGEGSAAEYVRASEAEKYAADARSSNPNVLTVEPGSRDRDKSKDRRRDKSPSRDTLKVEGSSRHREKSRERSRDRRRDKSPGPRSSGDTLTVDSGHKHKHREKSRERERKKEKSSVPDTLMVDSGRHRERSRDRRDKSPAPPSKSDSLTVGTGRLAGMTVAMAPASPLLESYYGTYQDCSPMPSPLLLASQNPNDDLRGLDALSSLSGDEGDGKKRSRRARFHDPEDITTQLANALKGTKRPDTGPLIHILPSLTHDQVMELRVEYKRVVKTGSERKGVNIAKHIRARLKDEDPLLMKACYAVALGKWEGEAYWANFWYQGDKTRRELLIEALMGRTNYEIAQIKDAFTDKKYDNSLTKCMKTELKEDKFKKAVLMVLDERRMEEYDHYGRRVPLDYALVEQDADDLRRAVKSEKGGETMMISIVVQRSDPHLRAVLKEYEHHYRSNFARDALKKSGNLVGELLAHILNGVINRPVRDALLLHHAVSASRKDGLRRELLISRVVRFHWDPHHMQAVKKAYRERYGKDLQDAVKDATSGEWGLFVRELCIARMPDDVRQVARVPEIH